MKHKALTLARDIFLVALIVPGCAAIAHAIIQLSVILWGGPK